MNRPEPIELENNLGPDAVTGEINRVPWMAYDVDEMDIYIAEKDKEITELKAENERQNNALDKERSETIKYMDELCNAKNEIERLTIDKRNAEQRADVADATVEKLKGSHYAEMVDAGMRERRLRRALWLAHAYKAKFKRWWLHLALDYEASMIRPNTKTINRIRGKIGNCEKSERKCRAKAEELK